MKNISKLSIEISKYSKKLINNLKEAQKETAITIHKDIIAMAPINTGRYVSSIQVSEQKTDNNNFSIKIFSDLPVGGIDPKWKNVPLAALLEWGTGIVGATSNKYPHGYPYRMTPWCYYSEDLNAFITTNGMIARPHFYPSLQKNKQLYIENIRKAVKNSERN